jgi:purine catabolism regulator
MTDAEVQQAHAVERLTRGALAELRAGRGLRGIVSQVAETLEVPVVLASQRRRVVAIGGLDAGDDPSAVLRAATLSVPVSVRGRAWGGLSLVGEPAGAAAVLARGAELVELELLHSTEPVEAEQRAQRELLADLLVDRTNGATPVVRAQLLGRGLVEDRSLFALAGSAARLDIADVEWAMAEAHATGLWARLDDELLVLGVAGIGGRTEQAAADVAAALVQRAAAAPGPVVALATVAHGTEEAGLRLRDARDTLAVARNLRIERPLVTASEMLVDRVLSRMASERDLSRAMQEELAPIATLTKHSAAVLLRTLQVYLDCGGAKTLAATRLGVGRQSLYRRLERIETLVGSLDDPARRLTLHLAVRARAALPE